MRAFVKLRQMLESNEELNRKFAAVIRKLAKSPEARGAAGSVKPGVERSATPGTRRRNYSKPAERPTDESS